MNPRPKPFLRLPPLHPRSRHPPSLTPHRHLRRRAVQLYYSVIVKGRGSSNDKQTPPLPSSHPWDEGTDIHPNYDPVHS